ncbi:MAG: hypothetical protein EOS76_10990 [Mesorhizobium sp.]|uniref:hypothetical protein n=1 Tax=unclassified Mesorhizobium TaxID=325217 RepID=UPI000F75993C|nr:MULTISPECIES: hypothetical protein [unclassified Mesorhizobium]RVC82517.1 hypothetical protein EN766_00920 [Mesorhizobium sp. M2A.F.Ca.ET.046.02.1.1]AZO34118.1 hypothetical protein EJ072_06145 [Mesorhizobium sp. M2A.F.Ca.ET.046.03.2.1]AZO71547.1 hypothetical protein EJ067_10525 [Mesorhizobium sp. M1D.F.Ca.ET.043.01.1.1]RWB39375.1 MAG: hypothetical protein EOQ44_28145 [Mesorhizobium sp.]RWE19713.1 MAG: hypothetical protein EOS76_10990 [Mesorhizobium sp.]
MPPARANSLGEYFRRFLDRFSRTVGLLLSLKHPVVQHLQPRGMVESAALLKLRHASLKDFREER